MNDILMAHAKSKLDLSMSSLPVLKVRQIKNRPPAVFVTNFPFFITFL